MTGDHDLLLTHATRWAEKKKRPLDAELLETVLDLRGAYDDRSPGSWPAGSAEQLVLVRWPPHGPRETPEPGALADTLETWWRFLRGTGRMASGSAEPAALVKELRRALPGMAAACADRSNWAQGRVLSDFGASIGIDLSMSESQEELQDKLDALMGAWNDLPMDQRTALMPDPTPKTSAGRRMTDLINSGDAWDEDEWDEEDDDGLDVRRGDPVISAREARTSDFTRACLALADWVGDRKEVTSIGVLRPAVAREAYETLDLFTWERAHAAMYTDRHRVQAYSEAEWDVLRQSAPHSWTSAADCEPLARLWSACYAAGLVDVHRTVAKATDARPATDLEWLDLGLRLFLGLVSHTVGERREVLLGTLLIPLAADDGAIPVGAITQWWLEHKGFDRLVADHGEDGARIFRDIYTRDVERVLHTFHDTGLWTRSDGWLTITEFGRDAGRVLAAAVDEGLFEED